MHNLINKCPLCNNDMLDVTRYCLPSTHFWQNQINCRCGLILRGDVFDGQFHMKDYASLIERWNSLK